MTGIGTNMPLRAMLCLLVVAASCASAPPSPDTRVKLVRDETRVDPNADQFICERETLLGSQIMEVHCRHKPDLDMDHTDSELLLQRPMGLATNAPPTNAP